MTQERTQAVPTGWPIRKIGDLFESWGGHTPSKSNADYWGDGTPWLSSKDVKSALLTTSTHQVTPKAMSETGLRVCPTGSVIVVVRSGILAHSLPVSTTAMPVAINQDLKAFYSSEPLMNEWLALFLRSSAQEILSTIRRDGTTVQSIQFPLLNETMIPVPPLEDRRRILHTMDSASHVQNGVAARLARVGVLAKRFRQSVMGAAYSGELTGHWRLSGGDGIPSRELDRWVSRRLDDVGTWQTGGTPSRSEASYFGGDVPWVKSGDLRDGPVAHTEESLTTLGLSSSAAKVMPVGTVSVALYGATIGRVGIFEIEAATNQACANCIPNASVIDGRFLFYFLLAERPKLVAAGQGGAQPNLTNGIIRDWEILLPPLGEQEEIVKRVDQLLNKMDQIDGRIRTASRGLDRVLHAFLAETFRAGRLVEHLNAP